MKSIDTLVIAAGGKGERISADLKKIGFHNSKVFFEVDGKPIIGQLIDQALEAKFQRIFLLISYYEKEFRRYLGENYSGNKKVIPVYGGRRGRSLGVPYVIQLIRGKLSHPFVYSDGNILYHSSLLKRMKSLSNLGAASINIAVSNKDHAHTHSCIVKRDKKIYKIDMRLNKDVESVSDGNRVKKYYCLGLMTFTPLIFSVPHFAHKRDLEYIVADIFSKNERSVKVTHYQGEWFSIHVIDDLDRAMH